MDIDEVEKFCKLFWKATLLGIAELAKVTEAVNENGVKGSSYNSENIRAFGTSATYRIAKLKRDHPEIAENLHRNDLSKEERKVMACRYKLLNEQPKSGEQPKDGEQPKNSSREAKWFSIWYAVLADHGVRANNISSHGTASRSMKSNVCSAMMFRYWN